MFQKFEAITGKHMPSTSKLLASSAKTDGELELMKIIRETHGAVDASRILCICNDLALLQRTRPDEIKMADKEQYKEWAVNWVDVRSPPLLMYTMDLGRGSIISESVTVCLCEGHDGIYAVSIK